MLKLTHIDTQCLIDLMEDVDDLSTQELKTLDKLRTILKRQQAAKQRLDRIDQIIHARPMEARGAR